MRIAEEILKKTINTYNEQVNPVHSFSFNSREKKLFSEMINEARKETIEECAAFSENYLLRDVCENDFGIKEKILSLINELQ